MTRRLRISCHAAESAFVSFASDERCMALAAAHGEACSRLWRSDAEALSLGRFHRLAPGCSGLRRRRSGGRAVPLGPGIVGWTLALPEVDWLDPGAGGLRPDQILNRGIRPLLRVLRERGVDAFYPGRDLVTVGGRAVAAASFTVARDGVTLLECLVAETESFASLAERLDRFDPDGVALVDRHAFASAASLEEPPRSPLPLEEWARALADAAEAEFACEAVVSKSPGAARWSGPAEQAFDAFCRERGPAPADVRTVAAPSLLGAVECQARVAGGTIRDLTVTGDLLAPFDTLDALAAECEGIALRGPQVRRALARVLGRSRSFLLGVRDLDALLLRLGD